MYQLSNLIKAFRTQVSLSEQDTAEALGLSPELLDSLEKGKATTSDLDVNMLRQIASKMTDHGYPITAEELMVKSGLIVEMALNDSKEGNFGKVAAPLVRPVSGRHPLKDHEWRVIKEAETFGLQYHVDIMWEILDLRAEDREALFAQLKAMTETLRLYKRSIIKS